MAACLLASTCFAGAAQAIDLVPSGSIVVRFESDPATCAGFGLCGRSGTMSWRPSHETSTLDLDGGLGFLDFSAEPAIVRSGRLTGSGRELCVDTAPSPFALTLRRVAGKRFVVSLRDDFGGFGFGRCAGPLAADFQKSLPESAPVSLKALRRRTRVDMTSQTPFGAGPFRGSVDSSLVLRSRAGNSSFTNVSGGTDINPAELPRGPREWIGTLLLRYRIERITGDVGIAYSGAPGFGCEPFDTCGLTGDLTVHSNLGAGTLTIGSYRRLPAHGRERLASALRALHTGQASAQAEAGFRPAADVDTFPENQGPQLPVTETAGFSGGPACTDSSHVIAGGLWSRRSATGLRIRLQIAGNESPDQLRTRCPGPAGADIGELAGATMPFASLGDDAPPLVLRPPAALTAPGFIGAGHGGLTVALRLIDRRVATHVIRKQRPPF